MIFARLKQVEKTVTVLRLFVPLVQILAGRLAALEEKVFGEYQKAGPKIDPQVLAFYLGEKTVPEPDPEPPVAGAGWTEPVRPRAWELTDRKRLTPGEAKVIYQAAWQGYPVDEIASEYGISEGHVRAIQMGRRWASVTGHYNPELHRDAA